MARINQLADDAEAPPPIGHNKPPAFVETLKEQLAEKHGPELAKVAPLAERANAAPQVIASDDDLKVWAEIGRDAAKLFKGLDEARKDEKRPLVAAVDGFFDDGIERSNRISIAAVQRATAWNKKKAEIARK
jgi:hypothetical protein